MLIGVLFCGQPAPQSAPPPVEKTSPVPYLLAADDVIDISVINFSNLSSRMVIPPDGMITVPLLEPIPVTGKTTTELAKLLTEKWRKYVVNPSVTVSLTQKRKQSVLFYGYVGRVGTLEYRPGLRIIEALAESGGAAVNGDLRKVTLTRQSGEKRVLDLHHPETKRGTEMDVELASGDVIYVPEYRTQITILGEVGAPGSIEYKENMTILDLLRAANNVKSETADLAAATLLRDGEEIKVDLDALLLRGDLSKNIILAAGDRLLVPEIKNRTYVLGAVRAPGYYQYKAGDRVLDALKASGGTTQEANMSKITVVRMNKAKEKDGKAPLLVADIEKMKKGDLSGNILLEPGDMLFVPNRKRGFSLQDMVGFTFGVQGISGIFQLLSGRLFR